MEGTRVEFPHKEKCTRKHSRCDIYVNPDNIGRSRIPIDTCDTNLLHFLANEITLAKTCACPSCQFRINMLRKLEFKVYENQRLKRIKSKVHHINNH